MKYLLSFFSLLLFGFPPLAAAQDEKNFVSVPVSVSDRDGRYVPGLKKEDFTIVVAGKSQKITFFAREDEPISVALLVDTSESTKDVLGDIREAARDFIDLLNPGDKCLVATFDSKLSVLSPLGDRKAAKESLDRLKTDAREGTIVYGAVDKIVRDGFANSTGRKVVVVLSDGKDFGSTVSREELFGSLEETDVMIYSVFYQTGSIKVDAKGDEVAKKQKTEKAEKPKKKKGYSIKIALPRSDTYTPDEIKLADKTSSREAVTVLEQLSETTAGRFYMSDAPNLGRIFRQIATELRQQYRLGFVSRDAATAAAAGDSDIIVKVSRPDAVVRARGKFRAKAL